MADEYDFVDFGCSKGGSMRFSMDALGGRRGIGVDIDPEKVAACRRAGFEAVVADLAALGQGWEKSARFVTLSHFLEHLPSREVAFRCLDSAISTARDFVFVRQPYFDADRYLESEGLRLFWSDWHGHPNRMLEAELQSHLQTQLSAGRIVRYVTFARGRIWSSDDEAIHSIDSPPDQHEWSPKLHPPKPRVDFDHPVFREVGAAVALRSDQFGDRVESFLADCAILHDERRGGNRTRSDDRGTSSRATSNVPVRRLLAGPTRSTEKRGTFSSMNGSDVPLPPKDLRVGGTHFLQDEDFRAAARLDVRLLIETCGLGPTSSVLDVGCGPGRLPVGLLLEFGEIGRYVGVDVQRRHIDWCNEFLDRPGMTFVLNDAPSERYNPGGVGGLSLPEDEVFDLIYSHSFLSHLRSPEAFHYLLAFRHYLSDTGRVFITAFVEPGVPDEEENPAEYGATPWSKSLHCVRYSESYFAEMVARAGLAVDHHSRGVETDGQSVFVLSALGGKGRFSLEVMRSFAREGLSHRRVAGLEHERSELSRQIAAHRAQFEQLNLKKAERDATVADLRLRLRKARKEIRQRDRELDGLQERLAAANRTLNRRSVRAVVNLSNVVPRRSTRRSEAGDVRSTSSGDELRSLDDAAAPVAPHDAVAHEGDASLGLGAPEAGAAPLGTAVTSLGTVGRMSRSIAAGDLVVYTALVGRYDELPSVQHLQDSGVQFVCFSDLERPDPQGWDVWPMAFYSNDPKRIALFAKTHPHLYFPDKEISMWVDGSMGLAVPPHDIINSAGVGEMLLSAFMHPDRRCVFDEADEVVRLNPDLEHVVVDQMRRYEERGLPRGQHPHETGVLVRRHNLPAVIEFDEMWWAELEAGSRRDQLSFGYVSWKCGLPVSHLAPPEVSVRNHPGFTKRKHLVDRRFRRPRSTPEAAKDRKNWNLVSVAKSHGMSSTDADANSADVDIVVPVHNALAHVQRCVSSLEHDREWSGRLLMVDDGSQTATREWCAEFARQRDRVELIRHDEARGFSGACNAGLSASMTSSVVVLNSDTVVPRGWVRRLQRVLNEAPSIGIVGPLSNAASWQSIPRYRAADGSLAVNSLPVGVSLEEMNDFLQLVSQDLVTPLVPTLNGFCLMLRRELLDAIGGFDEATFPRGYGEEVDLTLRATDAGFLSAVAVDTYVLHAKSQSFGAAKRGELKIAGRDALIERFGEERLNRAASSTRQHPVLEYVREVTDRLFDVP